MTTSKLTRSLAAVLVLAGCSGDAIDPGDPETPGATADDGSLEQELRLIPQLLRATDMSEAGKVLIGTLPSYIILSPESGKIDIDAVAIADAQGDAHGLAELFALPPTVHAGLSERDVLLLVAVPGQHAEALCNRFHFGHEDAPFIRSKEAKYLYLATASQDQVHALCLLPPSSSKGQDQGGTQNYGAGSYTARIKTLKCNDPRDWENWPYNGDEGRMRGFYDGAGGAQLWSSNNVESGDSFSINRYVHFGSNARIELFDYDSAPWNASDKLGTSWIYPESACLGDRFADFDGSGGGHNWNYDMTFRVYGPNCPCQSQEPAIHRSYQSETCTVTSSSVTSYTYYCSGGIYWRQAWGNRTRHCDTYNRTYNESCEMQTFVSSSLVTSCDHYETGVALGSPTQYGTCSTSYCGDGVCNGSETSSTCPGDCPSCYVPPCGQCLTFECPIE